jgi:hypothetical protein
MFRGTYSLHLQDLTIQKSSYMYFMLFNPEYWGSMFLRNVEVNEVITQDTILYRIRVTL